MSTDITLLSPVYSKSGMKGRLYYYKGNFFRPIDVHKKFVTKINIAIFKFCKENAEMVERDRADHEYKTLVELCDEQFLNKSSLLDF